MVRSEFLRQQRARQLVEDEERMLDLASAPNEEYNQRLTRAMGRRFLTERGIDTRGMETTRIPGIIQARGWARYTQTPARFHPGLVREFYASMVPVVFEANGPVWVRNLPIFITAAEINEYLSTQPDQSWELDAGWPIADVFDEEKENLAAELRRDNQQYREPNQVTIVTNDALTPELAFWLIFVNHNLVPSTHRTSVTLDSAKILFALKNDLGFDVGTIIRSQILKTGSSARSNLSFPCLITHFCRRAGVNIDYDEAALEEPMGDICKKAYNTFCTRNNLNNLPQDEPYRRRRQHAEPQPQPEGQQNEPARRARRQPRQEVPENPPPWVAPIIEDIHGIRTEQEAQSSRLDGMLAEQRHTTHIAETVQQNLDRRFFGNVFGRRNQNFRHGSSSRQPPTNED